ncbi:MAG: LD-carboxypeptidase [Bacteroidetes bacterium]|jgi:muramoyltetrapeptide carboxypeptidase|nr:LD-carboxypeptidase [Bacteroidota bacterium]
MIKPPPLKQGDKVALVAPAKTLEEDYLQKSIDAISSFDVEVIPGKSLYKQHFQFAGTDAERLHDLQSALDDQHVKAIFCLRGGHGTYRILPKLNFSRFLRHPKWIIGFSDITSLHNRVQQLGFCSVHGAMPMNFAKHPNETEPIEKIKQIMHHKNVEYYLPPHPVNRKGAGEGHIVGGNLSVLIGLQGTQFEIDTTNKILFLEDVGENLYHIDRMMMNMWHSGKLNYLKGLVIGEFNQLKDNKTDYGMDAYEIIHEKVATFDYPVIYGFPAGHIPHNLPLCLGNYVSMKVDNQKVQLST